MTATCGPARAGAGEGERAASVAGALPIAERLRGLAATSADEGLRSATFSLAGTQLREPIELFAAALRAGLEPSLWVQPMEGLTLVGIGRAWSVEASGPGRFGVVGEEWQRLLGSAVADTASARNPARGVGPVLFGGLGFTGDVPVDPAWVPFGAASMALPELIVAGNREGCWLTASCLDATTGPDRLQSLWERLSADAATAPPATVSLSPLSIAASHPDRSTWDRLVDRYAGAVGRGRLDKVVLARRVDLTAPTELDVVAALRRLSAGSPTSTTYAVARGASVFIGATPERLIATRGMEFQTVAVAGSIPRGTDASDTAALAARLLASDKDREEHQIVVEMLRTELEPLVAELVVAPAPSVAAFGNVQHLVTTVTGRLRDRAGILSLAALLHPTPAVGGEPRELALELIAEHEGFDRGWYAGPLGWIGADGDGELVVALRCAVVAGSTAALFTGCGIVADSDPEREWEESRNKLQVVASALGELLP